jgi:uncharacterized protein (TIGR00299 family) protein
MTLGALVDAGADWGELTRHLGSLGLTGYQLNRQEVRRGGIRGTKIDVTVSAPQPHRHLADLERIIGNSLLPGPVKEKSLQVFRRLAQAEAKIHATSPEKVHFHEVGATDAIIDIVGSALGFWLLGVEEGYASAVNTGEGQVQCAHGRLPVPAPATLELLQNVPIYSSGIAKELTTPTGAALLTTYCRHFGPLPCLKVKTTGYGAGHLELAIPNLLRVIIGEAASEALPTLAEEGLLDEEACQLMTNIDDMNPEFYGHIIDSFLAAGAMDVWLTPIQMKKSRPAATLNVLVHEQDLARFTLKILHETTALGLRVARARKYMLPFEIRSFQSSLGAVRIKVACRQGRTVNFAPEYEDCRRLAREREMPLKLVYEVIKAEFLNNTNIEGK